jgi:hypothetical protein
MGERLFGLVLGLFSAYRLTLALKNGAIVDRNFRAYMKRSEHPVQFWISVIADSVCSVAGAVLLFFAPLSR